MDLQIRIGCVWFSPHGWDMYGAGVRSKWHDRATSDLDYVILDLASAGF